MSLNPAVIKSGATWAPTGGTDLTFVPDGRAVSNGLSLVVQADTNLLTRRQLTLRATLPAAPARAGDYAKLGRCSAVLKIPFIASDGKLYLQTVKVDTAFHAEYAQASKNAAINDGAALLADSDFANFWQSSLLT